MCSRWVIADVTSDVEIDAQRQPGEELWQVRLDVPGLAAEFTPPVPLPHGSHVSADPILYAALAALDVKPCHECQGKQCQVNALRVQIQRHPRTD